MCGARVGGTAVCVCGGVFIVCVHLFVCACMCLYVCTKYQTMYVGDALLLQPKNIAMPSHKHLHGPHVSVNSTHNAFTMHNKLTAKSLVDVAPMKWAHGKPTAVKGLSFKPSLDQSKPAC